MFATKDEAQVAAKQFWDQQQRHSQQQQFQKSQPADSGDNAVQTPDLFSVFIQV